MSEMKLTKKQEKLKARIESAKKATEIANQNLAVATSECTHVVFSQEVGPRPQDGHVFGESAECEICGYDFGWYCSNSPDHACHYRSEGGDDGKPRHVHLVNGKTHDLPKDHDSVDETFDSCIFCGEPEERK